MARIRTVKPEYPKHRKVRRVSRDARLLNIHLWNLADDEGRLQNLPRAIIGEVFPDDEDVTPSVLSAWLDELEGVGLIEQYEVEGDNYIYCHDWRDHQNINRPKESCLPSPPGIEGSRNNHGYVSDTSLGEGKGREQGTGNRERNRERARARESDFVRFWAVYPRKRSKAQAKKAWAKLDPDEQLTERICVAVERATTSDDWQREGGRFVPYPATWLNAAGWEDEYEPAEHPANRRIRERLASAQGVAA